MQRSEILSHRISSVIKTSKNGRRAEGKGERENDCE